MDQDHAISPASSPSPVSCSRGTRVATESSDDVPPGSRELAVRASSGTQVRLLWQQGTRRLWVEVWEPATASALRIRAQPENALDVFHHPYAYAAARGLEFGTTGLHQPYSILVAKGRIFDRPLFEYLDAGQTVARSYAAYTPRSSFDHS